mmetsp:Transcript_11649/g.26397  ORF Transcript_11649/g.26397 Transcript_11649/m.26397 type:complete len:397 (+) Transcript_11649:621-1811(+)
MSGPMICASMIAWIWSLFPAVMFEMVQHASFLMDFLCPCCSRFSKQGSAWQLMTICVCTSSPVTMFPTVRSAGMRTAALLCSRSSTRRRATPASITAWILSFVPSLRYESAQQASVSTSSSVLWMSFARAGSAGLACSKLGCGLPRQKLLSVHVAFRSMLIFACSLSWLSSGKSAPWPRTRSRHLGLSPAMLPRAQTACSRTSSLGLCRSCTKMGTALYSMTTRVCSLVPLAMFVRAHAASNCSCGRSTRCRNATRRGTTPALMTASMGGDRSIDRSLRNCMVDSSCTFGSSLHTPCTISGKLSSFAVPPAAPAGSPALTLDSETSPGVPPNIVSCIVTRFFCRDSSLLSLRICTNESSLFLRDSSTSIDFLNPFFRASWRDEEGRRDMAIYIKLK